MFESQSGKISLPVFDPILLEDFQLASQSTCELSTSIAQNAHVPSASRHYLLTEHFRLRLLCRQTQFFSSKCCCRRVRPTSARKLQGKEPPARGLVDKLSFCFGESWRCLNFPSYPCSTLCPGVLHRMQTCGFSHRAGIENFRGTSMRDSMGLRN